MADFVNVNRFEDSISITFNIEDEKILAIGEKMNEINDEAYMNGYNWEAFFNYYLEKNAPELLDGMDTDPEADMYCAYYDLTPENESKAQRFAEIITSLIENEDELYRIVRDEGDSIEWD